MGHPLKGTQVLGKSWLALGVGLNLPWGWLGPQVLPTDELAEPKKSHRQSHRKKVLPEIYLTRLLSTKVGLASPGNEAVGVLEELWGERLRTASGMACVIGGDSRGSAVSHVSWLGGTVSSYSLWSASTIPYAVPQCWKDPYEVASANPLPRPEN